MNRYKDWIEQAQRDFEKAKFDVKNKFMIGFVLHLNRQQKSSMYEIEI